jgi:hypothetical protein
VQISLASLQFSEKAETASPHPHKSKFETLSRSFGRDFFVHFQETPKINKKTAEKFFRFYIKSLRLSIVFSPQMCYNNRVECNRVCKLHKFSIDILARYQMLQKFKQNFVQTADIWVIDFPDMRYRSATLLYFYPMYK